MPAPPPRLGVLVAAGALMASGAPLGASQHFSGGGAGGGGGGTAGSDGRGMTSADRRFATSLLTGSEREGRT
jgi:hypothetical protein